MDQTEEELKRAREAMDPLQTVENIKKLKQTSSRALHFSMYSTYTLVCLAEKK